MTDLNQFKSVVTLLEYFKEDKTCKDFFEQQRWGGNVCCVHCGNAKVYRTNRGFKCAEKTCAKKFSVITGTVFECSKIKLRYWFAALYLTTAHKKGVSSHQLARDLGVCQKTSWFMLHRIREMLRVKEQPKMLELPVQCDETFVGGKNKNRHASKKVKESQGRSCKDKTPVFGMLSDGQVRTAVVKDTKASTLKPFIYSMVKEGTIVITDEWNGYNGLASNFQHEVLNHKQKEFVRNGLSTNGLEGYWSLLKRGIFGIYHHVTPSHLHRYCDEFSYRYNTRKISDINRFAITLTQSDGRLSWKMLTDK